MAARAATLAWSHRRLDALVVTRSLELPSLLLVAGLAGYGVASGHGVALLAASLGAVFLVAVLLRPETALVVWVAAMLVGGRAVSHLHVGPAYVTEIFLLAVGVAVAARVLATRRAEPGASFALCLFAVLAVPAAASLLLSTDLGEQAWLRNLALVYYAFFAVVAAALRAGPRFYRALFMATVGGSLVALLVVFGGYGAAGGPEVTTTGATRIAHGSFSVPFGLAPLVILAAVQQKLVGRRFLLLVPPLLTGLVLVNHRSAWIAFALAAASVFAARPTLTLLFVGTVVAVVTVAFATSGGPSGSSSLLAKELVRAGSVADTEDPNAQYRLAFWRSLGERAVRSPLVGLGFDDYPPDLVPPRTHREDRSDPHNSFVALAYRLGPLAVAAALALLGALVVRGLRAARRATDPARRAALGALTAAVVYMGVFSAFNVALEVPYLAALFWIPIGLLAGACSRADAGDDRRV